MSEFLKNLHAAAQLFRASGNIDLAEIIEKFIGDVKNCIEEPGPAAFEPDWDTHREVQADLRAVIDDINARNGWGRT